MNPLQIHALASVHQRELGDAAASHHGPVRRGARRLATRRRVGIALVEAGLHLIATADRSPRSLTLAR